MAAGGQVARRTGVEIVDAEAFAIGSAFRKAASSQVESVRHLLECGERLTAKKAELGHGNWLPWLEQNAEVLGFGERAARMLVKAHESNRQLTSNLEPVEALAISRDIWGNRAGHRTNYAGENDWSTPEKYIELARQVLSEIDLDPATTEFAQQTIKATRYFTAETGGLKQEWGGRVWMNPPYAQPLIHEFIEKLIAECTAGRVEQAIVLTHNSTDTLWWHRLEEIAARICFTRGRIAFVDPHGDRASPPQGQTFFYCGETPERFDEVFSAVGCIR